MATYGHQGGYAFNDEQSGRADAREDRAKKRQEQFEREGMAWWNGLTVEERLQRLESLGFNASAADCYLEFLKAIEIQPAR